MADKKLVLTTISQGKVAVVESYRKSRRQEGRKVYKRGLLAQSILKMAISPTLAIQMQTPKADYIC